MKNLSERQKAAKRFVAKQLDGTSIPHERICDVIFSRLDSAPTHKISPKEALGMADAAGATEEDVGTVLAYLGQGCAELVLIVFREESTGEALPDGLVTAKLRSWHVDKAMTDAEWEAWSKSIMVSWEYAEGSDEA